MKTLTHQQDWAAKRYKQLLEQISKTHYGAAFTIWQDVEAELKRINRHEANPRKAIWRDKNAVLDTLTPPEYEVLTLATSTFNVASQQFAKACKEANL